MNVEQYEKTLVLSNPKEVIKLPLLFAKFSAENWFDYSTFDFRVSDEFSRLSLKQGIMNYESSTSMRLVFSGFYSISKSILDNSMKRSSAELSSLNMYHCSNLPDTLSQAEICWPVDAATVKTSSVPAIIVVFETLS